MDGIGDRRPGIRDRGTSRPLDPRPPTQHQALSTSTSTKHSPEPLLPGQFPMAAIASMIGPTPAVPGRSDVTNAECWLSPIVEELKHFYEPQPEAPRDAFVFYLWYVLGQRTTPARRDAAATCTSSRARLASSPLERANDSVQYRAAWANWPSSKDHRPSSSSALAP